VPGSVVMEVTKNADSPMELNSLLGSSHAVQLARGSGRGASATAANNYVCCGLCSYAQRAARASGSAGGSQRSALLGLTFKSSYNGSWSPLSWRNGAFSNWTVQVGDKTYQLHVFLLARESIFFRRHMSFAGVANPATIGPVPSKNANNLTDVLLLSCHSSFEDALDFIYSENQAAFEVPVCKALQLLQVADILDIGGLLYAMVQRIPAPLLMEHYCSVHVPQMWRRCTKSVCIFLDSLDVEALLPCVCANSKVCSALRRVRH